WNVQAAVWPLVPPVAGCGVKPRHAAIRPRSTKGNQHACHPANRSTAAQHRRHAQDRTMTQVAASIPTLRSSSRPAPRKTNAAGQWLAPVGLIALSLIPVLAGALRMTELMGSPESTANNARFVASPIPV